MARWRKCFLKERPRKAGSTWEVCYTDSVTHKRVIDRSFRDKKLAEQWKRRLELHLNNAGPRPVLDGGMARQDQESPPPPAERTPWDQAVENWLASRPYKGKTRSCFRSALSRFKELAEIEHVEDVTPERVEKVLLKLRNELKRSASTTAGCIRALVSFYSGRTDSPITAEIVRTWRPFRTIKKARPYIYSNDEFERIIGACDQVNVHRKSSRTPLWWRTFITTLRITGMRLEEVSHMIWRDVDFAAGIIKVQSHTGLPGVFPWSPKGKARRDLPMSPELSGLLARLQQEQPERVSNPYVFLRNDRYIDLLRSGTPETGEIMYGVLSAFKKIRIKAGVLEGTIHCWRRTAITSWLLQEDPVLSLPEVQILAGHQSITTTLAIYAEAQALKAVEKLRQGMKMKMPKPQAVDASDR
jgi:integrase